MGYIFRGSNTNITSTEKPTRYNCFFIIDVELPSEKCMEVYTENPCEEEGNFNTMQECEKYMECMAGSLNWFC